MFGSKSLSLPAPFPHTHRPHHLYSEPVRPQPSGQCHFLVLHAGSKEQRCPCQGYQHNRSVPGSLCDCTHAACYHAPSAAQETSGLQDGPIYNGNTSTALLDRIRKLEDAVQLERDIRESMFARERASWEREVRVLREALTPFYKSEQDMKHKLVEIEDNLGKVLNGQAQTDSRVASIESTVAAPRIHSQIRYTSAFHADLRPHHTSNGLGPQDVPAPYSASEERTSVSAEPMSPRQSMNTAAEPESPRSSGILNLVELPRHVAPRYSIPARLSPPNEVEEPRSSGFLGVDVNALIQQRKLARGDPPPHTYSPPSNSATKSPPNVNYRNMTPQSLPRVSPPNIHINGNLTEAEDRAYKKRKHQAELMALDVLANVSAASPVIT